jgi:3',5'-cyclic AMP phosphodiesterase CpdA
MNRPRFLRQILPILIALPLSAFPSSADSRAAGDTIRFGICADVHKDLVPDADARLAAFIREASKRKLDFILQLGDFCRPLEANRGFLSIWNGFPGEKRHVLGNHDMDGGFSRVDAVRFLGAPARYYSFDKKGFHFVVLDGNDPNPSPNRSPGYARFIGEEQRRWLIADLKSACLPVILFSHQSIESDGLENAAEIRAVLEAENKSAGFAKVLAGFSGHHHTDYAVRKNGIDYIQVNSMSYRWIGEKFPVIRYSVEIDKAFPALKYTIPYREPLFAFVEIDDRAIRIEGRKSVFVGPGPAEMGLGSQAENDPIKAVISSRRLKRPKGPVSIVRAP